MAGRVRLEAADPEFLVATVRGSQPYSVRIEIGQSRNVFAYLLVARGTVEEKVLELQTRKRHLVASIFGEGSGLLRDLKREDVELLLS